MQQQQQNQLKIQQQEQSTNPSYFENANIVWLSPQQIQKTNKNADKVKEIVQNLQQMQRYKHTVQLSNSSYSQWEQNNMRAICSLMKEWNQINALWIGDIFQMDIIHQIGHIKFAHLVRIDISGNNIETLEGIQNFSYNMPALQEIYLQNNHFHSIKSLSRGQFPSLYFIGLGSNLISDASCLVELNCSTLSWLGLQNQKCPYFSNDIKWVLKLNTDKLSMLQLQNQNRIKQNRLDEAFKRRFNSLQKVNRI